MREHVSFRACGICVRESGRIRLRIVRPAHFGRVASFSARTRSSGRLRTGRGSRRNRRASGQLVVAGRAAGRCARIEPIPAKSGYSRHSAAPRLSEPPEKQPLVGRSTFSRHLFLCASRAPLSDAFRRSVTGTAERSFDNSIEIQESTPNAAGALKCRFLGTA